MPPVTDRHRLQTGIGHRQPTVTGRYRSQTATYQNLNFRTNRRKEMKDINERADHTKEHMGLTT